MKNLSQFVGIRIIRDGKKEKVKPEENPNANVENYHLRADS